MKRNITSSSVDYDENRTMITWTTPSYHAWLVTERVYGDNSTTMTTTNNDTSSSLLICQTFELQYNIIPSVICVFLFLFGILFCFLGYRLLKATTFVTGFMFGSSIVYFVCIEESVLPLSGKIGVSLGVGLVCGMVAMLVLYVGLFITGFQCGILIGVVFFAILELFHHLVSKWIPIGVLLGTGVAFALLTLYWQKRLMIVGTSVLGSALVLLAIDYFVDAFRLTEYCYDRLTARHSSVTLCWFSWFLFATWPALAVASCVIQSLVTASNYDHRSNCPKGAQRKIGKNNRRQKFSSVECDQHHYLHLYQIRRMNGDVVSKSYIKSIEEAHHLSPSLQLLSHATTEAEDAAAAANRRRRVSSEDTIVMTSVIDLDNASCTASQT